MPVNKSLSFETILEMGDKKDRVHHLNMIFLFKVSVLHKVMDGNAVG